MMIRNLARKPRSWVLTLRPILLAGVLVVTASPALAKEQRIMQTDSIGNIPHDQPSWIVEGNGRIIAVDRFRTKRYDLPGYQIKGDRVYETDRYGSTRYHRPSFVIQDGR